MTLMQLTQIQNDGERLRATQQWQDEMVHLVRELNLEAFDNGMRAAKSTEVIETKKTIYNAILDKLFAMNPVS